MISYSNYTCNINYDYDQVKNVSRNAIWWIVKIIVRIYKVSYVYEHDFDTLINSLNDNIKYFE